MKIFNYLTFILLLIISGGLRAENISKIEIQINNGDEDRYFMYKHIGDKTLKVDSALLVDEKLMFSNFYNPGMYSIIKNAKGFSFLVNEHFIQLQTDWVNPIQHLVAEKSIENMAWFNYLRKRNESYNKLNLLKNITLQYDPTTEFYQHAKDEFYRVQNNYRNLVENVPESTLAHAFMLADLNPVIKHNLPFNQQSESFKEKWFEFVDWQNNHLINSDILTNKIDEFLGLYSGQGKTREQMQEVFMGAVDHLLPLTLVNPKMQLFVVDFLIRKFEKIGMDEVIVYIGENYSFFEGRCESENEENDLLSKLKKFEKMSIGKVAPEIILPDLSGNIHKSKNNFDEKNLIVFWSTRCSHCTSLMPQLSQWYDDAKHKGWTITAISLDKDKTELNEYLKNNNLEINVLCDFQGWKSPVALDFNITATPTMIVLDKSGTILGKPFWLRELNEF